jgi:hypothetical protein
MKFRNLSKKEQAEQLGVYKYKFSSTPVLALHKY